MNYEIDDLKVHGAKIRVIGVGGGGGNAVNTMINSGLEGVEFVAANTDLQALRSSLAQQKLQIGKELAKGLGAGSDPDFGRDAALEDRQQIQEVLQGADMVFITAGMGGGTGTGGAPVIAQICRDMGTLTVAVVTKPFMFEGRRRRQQAEQGIQRLKESVDTLITIPNQRLLQVAKPDTAMVEAFKMADNVLVNAVKGISDIITIPGLVNVDFADVKTVMSCMGEALMGIGHSEGPGKAIEAAREAISSPLLEDIDIEGATGILMNITAGPGISLLEVNEACCVIQDAAHENANIIFGAVVDESMGDNVRVTVIATGFPTEEETNIPRETQRTSKYDHFRASSHLSHHRQESARVSPEQELTKMTFRAAEEPRKELSHQQRNQTTPNEEIITCATSHEFEQKQQRQSWYEHKGAAHSQEDENPTTGPSTVLEPNQNNLNDFSQLATEVNTSVDEALNRELRESEFVDDDSDLEVPAYIRFGKETSPSTES